MTPDLILWASDDVLNLYIKFRQQTTDSMQESLSNPILLFGQMLLAMRKDLGHQNKQLKISLNNMLLPEYIDNFQHKLKKILALQF